jgi:hypothetical protein
MALRTDLPKIPTYDEPTIWNRNMGAWAFSTSLGFSVIPLVNGAAFRAAARNEINMNHALGNLAAIAVGGLIGGYRQKNEMERELTEGKTVSDPTFWNSRVLSNYMTLVFPLNLASAAFYLHHKSKIDAVIKNPELIGQMHPGKTLAAVLVGFALGVAPIIYGIKGGFDRKHEMQQEYEQAVESEESHGFETATGDTRPYSGLWHHPTCPPVEPRHPAAIGLRMPELGNYIIEYLWICVIIINGTARHV